MKQLEKTIRDVRVKYLRQFQVLIIFLFLDKFNLRNNTFYKTKLCPFYAKLILIRKQRRRLTKVNSPGYDKYVGPFDIVPAYWY